MLTLNTLKPAPGSRKKRKRVGRGGSHGTTATRGSKGQKARSGYSRSFGFEGGKTSLVKQLPKLRGFTSIYPRSITLSLTDLNDVYTDGQHVTSTSLRRHNLIPSRNMPWKVVSKGKISKKLLVFGSVSVSAKKEIEAAGGSVTVKVKQKPEKKKKQY